MNRAAVTLACLMVLCGAGRAVADGGLSEARVSGLGTRLDERQLLVSFRLENAFPADVHEALHAGNQVSFRHRVDLLLRRPWWITNRLLGRTVVETRVEYDSLTRLYRLYRHTENRHSRAEDDTPLDLEVRRSTKSLEEAVDWLTVIEDVPLPWLSDWEESERLKIRVSSSLGRHFVLWVIPSTYSPSAELRLEF